MQTKIPFLLIAASMLLASACGQKGPLIVEVPTSVPGSTQVESVEKEVSQDDPIINVQTDESSTAR